MKRLSLYGVCLYAFIQGACSSASVDDEGLSATAVGGGTKSEWVPAVSIWQGLRKDSDNFDVGYRGSGFVVGPHHVASAAHVLEEPLPEGYSRYITSGYDWQAQDIPMRAVAYVVSYPRHTDTPRSEVGDVGIAVMHYRDMRTDLDTQYSAFAPLAADDSTVAPIGEGAVCGYKLIGHGLGTPGQSQEERTARVCLVASTFLSSAAYTNTLEQYFESKGVDIDLTSSDPPAEGLVFVSENGPFLPHVSDQPAGYICPGDSGSPVLNAHHEVVAVATALGLSDLFTEEFTEEPFTQSCPPEIVAYGNTLAWPLSKIAPGATITPREFIQRVVANCTPEMGLERCEKLVACNEADGHYQLQADGTCVPSCGELARQSGINPDEAPGKCAVWCYKPMWEDQMPFWSDPEVLGKSYDCDECRYYPPGAGDPNGYDDCE